MWYWVETKDKTLEEIDALFEGEKHSEGPNLVDVMREHQTVRQRGQPSSTSTHGRQASTEDSVNK